MKPTPAGFWCEADTPIGRLLLAGDGAALTRVHFQSGPQPLEPAAGLREDTAPFAGALAQLGEYFSGARRSFTVALAPRGTEFQLAVWQALRTIPYGETLSYAELARRVGRPGAARAVGLANGTNPLPIFVPCHRVIGSDGSLTGFGGGLPIKHALLSLEGAACVADIFSSSGVAASGLVNRRASP